ncbi:TPA: hypothetical protein ACJTOG_001297, partial [Klebsiella aerogenes]
ARVNLPASNTLIPGLRQRVQAQNGPSVRLRGGGPFFLLFASRFIEHASTLSRKQYLRAAKNGTIVAVYTVFRFSHGFDRCAKSANRRLV